MGCNNSKQLVHPSSPPSMNINRERITRSLKNIKLELSPRRKRSKKSMSKILDDTNTDNDTISDLKSIKSKSVFSKDSNDNIISPMVNKGRRGDVMIDEFSMESKSKDGSLFKTLSELTDNITITNSEKNTGRTNKSNLFSDIMSNESLIPIDEFFDNMKDDNEISEKKEKFKLNIDNIIS